jgi:HEAT repeat protein
MTRRMLTEILMLIAGATVGCRGAEHAGQAPREVARGPTIDIVQFSEGGMSGGTKVEWDPKTSSVLYESWKFGTSEKWSRQPSPEEWRRFWIAMDAAGVWNWKGDYGTATHTDCVAWTLALAHGSKRISSRGCSVFPNEASFRRVVAELTALRGEASVASGQGLGLAKRLKETDWKIRMQTVQTLGDMGPAAGAAAGALVELLDAPSISMWRAAPGPEPIAVARSVQPLLVQAERATRERKWDEAIDFYDRALSRDPQNEVAARGRYDAIEARRYQRYRAEHAGQYPQPASTKNETARKEAELADAAVSALAKIGEPAVTPLVQVLQDGHTHRRRRAAKALGQIGPIAYSAIPALTLGLKDPEFEQAAARALMRVDQRNAEKYLPLLVKGLDARDPDVARLSAAALAEFGTPAALPGLIHALDDERTYSTALGGIYRMGPRAAAAIPSIIPSLRDGREARRQSAASTLGEMRASASKAIPALIDAVRNDSNGGVRENAARALGAMGPAAREAVPALVDNLRYGDRGYSVATGASIALAQIGRPAVPALIAALKCDHLEPATPISPTGYQGPVYPETENVRVFAVYTLSSIDPPPQDAIPALTESLRDPSPRVREAAARALKSIKPH